jgi:hypothetical protein
MTCCLRGCAPAEHFSVCGGAYRRRCAAIGYARPAPGEVPFLVLCLAFDRDARGAVLGAICDEAAVMIVFYTAVLVMIVFYTAVYCAMMTFLAKEALVELKGKFSKL